MNDSSSILTLVLKAIDQASEILAGVGDQMTELQGQVEEANSAISSASDKAAEDVAAANDSIMASNDELIGSYVALQRAVIDTKIEQQTAAAQSAAVQDVSKGAAGSLGVGQLISNPYVLAGAAIVGATALVIKSASDFQQSITRLYTTAGETAPLKSLENAMLDVGSATGESSKQLAQAMYYISSAGYNALSGVQLLRAAAEGAQAEGADVTSVANALSTVMVDYGANADQATSYMNQLITVVSQGKTTLQDLAPALGKVLQPAAAVGLSLAQVGGAIDAITASGQDAQQATQDVTALIKELSGSFTTTEINNLQNYGLNVVSLEQNLGKTGLAGTIEQVYDAIIQKVGPGGLVMQNALQSAQVATQDLNRELASAPSNIQSLANALLNGSMSYTAFRKAAQALPEGDTHFLQQIEAAYNKTQQFNSLLTQGKPGQQTVLSALGGVFGQSDSLQGVQAMIQNMPKVNADIQAISKSASEGGKNIDEWSAVSKNLNIQFDITRQMIENGATALGLKLMPVLTAADQGLNSFLKAFGPNLSGVVKEAADSTATFFDVMVGNWGGAANSARAFGNAFLQTFGLNGVWKTMSSAASQAFSSLSQSASTSFTHVEGTVNNIASELSSAWARATARVNSIVDPWLQNFPRKFSQTTTQIVQAMERYDTQSFNQWGHYLSSTVAALGPWGTQLANNTTNAFNNMGKAITNWWTGLPNVLKGDWQRTQTTFTDWGTNIGKWTTTAVGNVGTAMGNYFSNLPKTVTKDFNGITAVIQEWWKNLPKQLEQIVKGSGSKTANDHVQSISDIWKHPNTATKIVEAILFAFGLVVVTLSVGLINVGINLVRSVITGMEQSPRLFKDAAAKMIDDFVGQANTDGAKITAWANTTAQAIVKYFTDIPKEIGSAVSGIGSGIQKDVSGVLHSLHIPGFASGVQNFSGGYALVGENGPEMVNLPQGSNVYPAGQTQQMMGGAGGGGNLNVTINVNAPAGLVSNAQTRQLSYQVGQQLMAIAKSYGGRLNLPGIRPL